MLGIKQQNLQELVINALFYQMQQFVPFQSNYENSNEILKKFSEIARTTDGKLTLKEFSEYFD